MSAVSVSRWRQGAHPAPSRQPMMDIAEMRVAATSWRHFRWMEPTAEPRPAEAEPGLVAREGTAFIRAREPASRDG